MGSMFLQRTDRMSHFSFAAWFLAMVSLASTASADQRPEVISSKSEIVKKLPLTGAKNYRYWTPYVVAVPGLKAADIVQCHAQAEVTTPYSFATQVSYAIVRSSAQGLDGVPST